MRLWIVLLVVLLMPATAAVVQLGMPPVPDASQGSPQRRPPTPDEVRRQKELEKLQAKQRYQDIRRDTDQLVALANQLKQEVDAAGQETLSLSVVKKADQIEKLAKSVKQKMKGD